MTIRPEILRHYRQARAKQAETFNIDTNVGLNAYFAHESAKKQIAKVKRFSALNEASANGETIYVTTSLKQWKIRPDHVTAWRDAGYEFFKIDDTGSTFMIARTRKGKPVYDCIDFCHITTYV